MDRIFRIIVMSALVGDLPPVFVPVFKLELNPFEGSPKTVPVT